MNDDAWIDHAGSPDDEAERQALMAAQAEAVEAGRAEAEGLELRRKWPISPVVPEGDAGWAYGKPVPAAKFLCETTGTSRSGVFELGATGLLIGEGGAGKGWVALDLALAVAAGGDPEGSPPWLGEGGMTVKHPGHVLFLTAEDRRVQIDRRLVRLRDARFPEAGYTDAKPGEPPADRADRNRRGTAQRNALEMAGRRLHILATQDTPGLESVRFQTDGKDKGGGEPSPDLHALRARLCEAAEARAELAGKPQPWRLIVLDTLSRLASSEAETDNAIAARLVQAVELLSDCNPPREERACVLVLHHTSKGTGRGQGARASRGSSALTDNARWVGQLTNKMKGDDETPWRIFSFPKANHSPSTKPLCLWQAPEDGAAIPAGTDPGPIVGGVLYPRPRPAMNDDLEASQTNGSKGGTKATKQKPGIGPMP